MLAYKCGPAFAGLTGVVIAAYTAFTIGITQWRTRFRQDMNKADSEAGKQARTPHGTIACCAMNCPWECYKAQSHTTIDSEPLSGSRTMDCTGGPDWGRWLSTKMTD